MHILKRDFPYWYSHVNLKTPTHPEKKIKGSLDFEHVYFQIT